MHVQGDQILDRMLQQKWEQMDPFKIPNSIVMCTQINIYHH